MSNSVRPHRWQATRLPRPWDSPGKNTGVGCHFLLQCMKVKRESEVARSCPTLSDPMDCSLSGSSIHGIFQARVLEWSAITFNPLQYSCLGKSHGQRSMAGYSPQGSKESDKTIITIRIYFLMCLYFENGNSKTLLLQNFPGKSTGVGCHCLLQRKWQPTAMATHCNILAWENPMDREAWQATIHRVTKSLTRLNN